MLTTMMNALAALTPTHWISIAALAISLTSLTVSTAGYLRDRPRLKIRAVRYQSDETPGYIEVKAVNAGRRPIFLIMLWGKDSTGCGSGVHFDYEGPGIKLGEHEFKTFRITHLPRGKDEYSADGIDNDNDTIDFERMLIEDSLGERYEIPKLKVLLPALRADYKDWCERTGYWKTPAPTT